MTTTSERSAIAARHACSHKVAFVSRREAKTVAKRTRNASAPLRVYTCEACGQFHLSSMSKRDFRQRVVARIA